MCKNNSAWTISRKRRRCRVAGKIVWSTCGFPYSDKTNSYEIDSISYESHFQGVCCATFWWASCYSTQNEFIRKLRRDKIIGVMMHKSCASRWHDRRLWAFHWRVERRAVFRAISALCRWRSRCRCGDGGSDAEKPSKDHRRPVLTLGYRRWLRVERWADRVFLGSSCDEEPSRTRKCRPSWNSSEDS